MRAAGFAALLLPIGCGRSTKPEAKGQEVPSASADAGSGPPLTAFPAIRCSECHNKAFAEWKGSAHAGARSSPIYQTMRSRSGEEAACDRCHAPLARLIDPTDLAVSEGVTCEVCHGIKDVEVTPTAGSAVYRLEENVKYGPLCDARDHYFHKMGCSPLHKEARFCAGCHLFTQHTKAGADLGVFTEFDEWSKGPYAKTGTPCPDCHMPESQAEVAAGSAKRPTVSHHGFLGLEGDLRRRALSMSVTVEADGGKLAVRVSVKNEGAGHSVPTGLPGRQVLLAVRALDEHGEAVDKAERVYARTLVDAAGAEVPFYAATAQGSDNRLGPGETRAESMSLEGPPAGELRAELVWRELSPALAGALAVAAPREISMGEVRIPFGKVQGRGRARLPKTASIHP